MKVLCKRCGSELFYRNYRAGGWWKELVKSGFKAMEVVESFTDDIKIHDEPKTITCADCKLRIRNPDYKP